MAPLTYITNPLKITTLRGNGDHFSLYIVVSTA